MCNSPTLHFFSEYFNVLHHQYLSVSVAKFHSSFLSGIAMNALVLSEKFGSPDQKPLIFMNHFLGTGHLDSYHLNASQLRKGFATGLSSGDAGGAFNCASIMTHFSIISAEKDLTSLLKEIDYYLSLLETYKSELAKKYILCYRETVATLIDRGEATGIDAKLSCVDIESHDPKPTSNKLQGVFYFHQMFRNYWLGYTERCHHYAQKALPCMEQGPFGTTLVYRFYHGKKVQALHI